LISGYDGKLSYGASDWRERSLEREPAIYAPAEGATRLSERSMPRTGPSWTAMSAPKHPAQTKCLGSYLTILNQKVGRNASHPSLWKEAG
jgi:hypothetical protein